MEFDTLVWQKSLASLAKKNRFKACLFHALHKCDLKGIDFINLQSNLKLFEAKPSNLE
jgi:hypothetical protein